MKDKSPDIDYHKISLCLEQVSLSLHDHLKEQDMKTILQQLSGKPFDLDTFDQLWDQCQLNSRGQAKVQQFMANIIKAQSILIDKLKTIDIQLMKLEHQDRPDMKQFGQQLKHKEDLKQLQFQRISVKQSLGIIRQPFQKWGILAHLKTKSSNQPDIKTNQILQEEADQLFQYDQQTTAQTLTKILYLTVIMLMICLIGTQLFNRFLDMTLCCVILMGYASQAISRKIVKFNLVLLTVSFGISFIWLILYSNSLWDSQNNYDYPASNNTYLKFAISFLFLSQVLKLVLIYYYLTQLQINQLEVYQIPLGSKYINMQKEPTPPNPTLHPLTANLIHIFNRKKVEE